MVTKTYISGHSDSSDISDSSDSSERSDSSESSDSNDSNDQTLLSTIQIFTKKTFLSPTLFFYKTKQKLFFPKKNLNLKRDKTQKLFLQTTFFRP